MTSLAAAERAALVDALTVAGPDAATLCAGWTAHDLAAHLVARERRPDSGPGLLVPALAGWTERVRRGYLSQPFAELVELIRTGPPLTSPFALPGVDAAVNLTEHFVHCEDVRRAVPDWEPRVLDAQLGAGLWRMVAGRGRMLFRRSKVGLTLQTPDGLRREVISRQPAVTLTGEPGELLLYAFGRIGHAQVELDGDPAAVEEFRRTRLGI